MNELPEPGPPSTSLAIDPARSGQDPAQAKCQGDPALSAVLQSWRMREKSFSKKNIINSKSFVFDPFNAILYDLPVF